MTIADELVLIARANAEVPADGFRLRAWPGKTFRVARDLTFVSEGVAQVVVQVQTAYGPDQEPRWVDFWRGSVAELRVEVHWRPFYK